MSFEAVTPMTAAEQKVSDYLTEQLAEYSTTARAAHAFPPTQFFYDWDMDSIKSSFLYKVVEAMPKGGALHLHSGSSGSTDWIIDEGIKMDGGHVFWDEDDASRCIVPIGGAECACDEPGSLPMTKGMISFYPGNATAPAGFVPASAVPASELRELLTSNGSLKDMDSDDAWRYFDKVFLRGNSAMAYRPFYIQYLLNSFQVHWDDRVQHVEIRALCGSGGLGDLFDETGKVYSGDEVIDTYRQALAIFRASDPSRKDFSLRLIVSSLRKLPEDHISDDIEIAFQLKSNNLDLVTGFDIVAEEDPNHRTLDYLDQILGLKQKEDDTGVAMPLYFHDGESNDRTNTNMVDAILLGSKRVGHGFNSYFFPVLFGMMKERGTVLEVNPISNQVLRYVDNLEVHPANQFIAQGIQVVISSDDPGIFGYTGLTLDMWTSLVAFQLDLRGLKTLAMNSLKHSGLEGDAKQNALKFWQKSWNAWIEDMLELIPS
jgi:adenosine deaminase CECR1